MSSLAVKASGELVIRGLKHGLYGLCQPVNGVDAAEVGEINHLAELLIAVKKWEFQRLDNTRYERVSLAHLHVPPGYVSEIEEKQELAVIRERHGANRAFVVLRGTKFNITDLVDDMKIPFRQLHTGGNGRGARALEVVRLAVSQYGTGSVSVVGHSLGAAIALVVSSELANRQKPVILDTHLFNLPLVTVWDLCKLLLSAASSSWWLMNKVTRRLGLNCKVRRLFSGTVDPAARGLVPNIYLNEYDLINKSAIRRLRCCSDSGGNRVAFPANVYINRYSFDIEVVFHMPNLKQESIPRELLAQSVASSTSGPGMRGIFGSFGILLDLLESPNLEEQAAVLFCFV